jgi:hypothetical protein
MNTQPRPDSFFDSFAKPTMAAAYALRPGERLVAGRPSIFDLGMLNEHLAREAVANAPADVSVLTNDELDALHAHCNCFALDHDEPTRVLRRAVIAEQSRRGLRTAFEGGAQAERVAL